jgi:hypothetical protein
VPIPDDVSQLLGDISAGLSLGLTGIADADLECSGFSGYQPRLIFWFVLPLIAVLVVLLVFVARLKLAHRTGRLRRSEILQQSAPSLFRVFFVLYPIVTHTAFQAFPCYTFDEGAWLVSDVSIMCYSTSHTRIRLLALVTILLYPVGILVFSLVLLTMSARAIREHHGFKNEQPKDWERRLADATSFLWRHACAAE